MTDYSITSLIWLTVFGLGLAGTLFTLAWVFLPHWVNFSRISIALSKEPNVEDKSNPNIWMGSANEIEKREEVAQQLRQEISRLIFESRSGIVQLSSPSPQSSDPYLLVLSNEISSSSEEGLRNWFGSKSTKIWEENPRASHRPRGEAVTGLLKSETLEVLAWPQTRKIH